MKFLRLFFRILLGLIVAILLFLAVSLAPVDETPYQQMTYYTQTKQRLGQLPSMPAPKTAIQAGWAKTNITPNHPTATAGYGARLGKKWSVVKDSIYVRSVVLDNGATRVALIGLDLLITPPTVVEQLKKRLPEVGLRWENVFIGAIHSHNSAGGWAPKLVGHLLAGSYEPALVNQITDGVLKTLASAQQQLSPVQIGFTQVNDTTQVYNRLTEKGRLDPYVRLLKLQKASGQSALLCTYAGHATIFDFDKSQYLSRDYPGALVDRLEKKDATFALFMAGAVGSTGPKEVGEDDFAQIRNYADTLAATIETALPTLKMQPDSALGALTLPLGLREPQARVLGNWRVRPWLFYALYGDYPSELKALRIGNTVLVGTPCDFSGMLVADFQQVAARQKINLIITSFNGGYVGYITPDQYYHTDAYETQAMNWFGPYNGAYFEEMMMGLIRKL